MDEFIQVWHNSMLPTAQAQKGWNSARLLVDRETGKVIVVGFWETEADALASGAGSAYAEKQRDFLGSLAIVPPAIEHYEVAGEA
jgi:heme-degrading monooxygenase HmoA